MGLITKLERLLYFGYKKRLVDHGVVVIGTHNPIVLHIENNRVTCLDNNGITKSVHVGIELNAIKYLISRMGEQE